MFYTDLIQLCAPCKDNATEIYSFAAYIYRIVFNRKLRNLYYIAPRVICISFIQIKIWFQNRRARERRDDQDSSKKDLNLIKKFLIKTRPSEAVSDDVQDLSMSAFKPCHKLLQ